MPAPFRRALPGALALGLSLALSASTAVAQTPIINAGRVTIFNQLNEGNSGTTEVTFAVRLHIAPPIGTTVRVSVGFGGTARLGSACTDSVDYTVDGPVTRQLTWLAGDVSPRLLTARACGDVRDDEDTEYMAIGLTGATGGLVDTNTAQIHIRDDDAPPAVLIESTTALEPLVPFTTRVMQIPVRLSAPSNRIVAIIVLPREGGPNGPVLFGGATPGTACGGTADYIAQRSTVTFRPGVLEGVATVPICHDDRDEGVVLAVIGGKSTSSHSEVFSMVVSAVALTTASWDGRPVAMTIRDQ